MVRTLPLSLLALAALAAKEPAVLAAPPPRAAARAAPVERELGVPLFPGAEWVAERSADLEGLMFRDTFRTAAPRSQVVKFYEERLGQECPASDRAPCTFYVDHLTSATRRGGTVVVPLAAAPVRATEFQVTTYVKEPPGDP